MPECPNEGRCNEVDPHKRGTDRKADGRRRRIADNLNKLTEALGELPPGRSSLLMENIGMAMIDADLRAGIMDSGLTHYALAKLSGIAPSNLTVSFPGNVTYAWGPPPKSPPPWGWS